MEPEIWLDRKQKRDEQKQAFLLECKVRGKEMRILANAGRDIIRDLKQTFPPHIRASYDPVYQSQHALLLNIYSKVEKYIYISTADFYKLSFDRELYTKPEVLKEKLKNRVFAEITEKYKI